MSHLNVYKLNVVWFGEKKKKKKKAFQPLVSEKSGHFYFSSRSGKYQGILQNGQGNFKYQEIGEKSRNFLILAQNCLDVQVIYPFWVIKTIFSHSLGIIAN